MPRDEEIVVLSMYDGIGTGRYCLEQMGFTNVRYYAYEIDPYAIKVSSSNYPDIIQLGDAFDLRREDWTIPGEEDIIMGKPTSVIEFAEKRLADELHQNELGLDNAHDIQYWRAYLDGAKAQAKEDGREEVVE